MIINVLIFSLKIAFGIFFVFGVVVSTVSWLSYIYCYPACYRCLEDTHCYDTHNIKYVETFPYPWYIKIFKKRLSLENIGRCILINILIAIILYYNLMKLF